jgi:hypothetical protein
MAGRPQHPVDVIDLQPLFFTIAASLDGGPQEMEIAVGA